ncbi:MAG: poly-beta-1,6-N-acetyl-D-glucosamine N-deacetylase PgaB [Candidatus Omnitrophica bacterium]|nr:poly-beta-1,6-N-acetyl-D-glucosamine N-deacetylase PgaB [Candidatus Omnitrophota bacterium]MBU1047409.1 poly-beta-1,6-N-acetyl-D-glucosamine N-deacetylase PgaB [Candidatus Omnitrophota bacterium]MBU1630814.1 poly-beta-1,6-N-acetyl-D-glucosamine N-deacetylase PgaB [Candidatus Omnitrophota bacterium]MBU1767261.1 poly-beta-1,6-N-acetyl-D-glucosamine N-deacetylase PgaB [Candidatus Omnitrophota bacterium]MBU1888773.1 poly-beta-1,6-N-acetyl-D-glucosamine N-deacetylase PgaB [Candidatus Omnitrophota
MRKIIGLIFILCFTVCVCNARESTQPNTFKVIIYHDTPKDVNLDDFAVDRVAFVQQIEYLRAHGYNFISFEDILKANKGEIILPEKAVLLRSDDAYLSFYEFVYPVLKLYGYPSLLGVVTNWVELGQTYTQAPLMNWEQLQEVANSGLVEIASHSHNLHNDIPSNPQGNTAWAAVTLEYYPDTQTYETEEHYRQRIYEDLLLSRNILREKLGVNARAIIWPYGEYSQASVEEAKKAGFEATFDTTDKLASIDNLDIVHGSFVMRNPTIEEFIENLKRNFSIPMKRRIMQADLDLLYDTDPVQQTHNIDKFIERAFSMKVNTVYLQAFCDDEGDGAISSVYFHNRVLPVRADLFNHVANQLSIRGIRVYAWMPMLSIVLPDEKENERLRVMQFRDGEITLSDSWYPRLSPFSAEARQKLIMLYEDLSAANPRLDGVVFQDDGYLNDFEDFNPAALAQYLEISGGEDIPYQELNEEQKQRWTKLKTETLIELTEELKEAFLHYNPFTKSVRILYAPVLTEPESEEWFAQNYADSLKAYDYVLIMAYPKMEEVKNSTKWLQKLVQKAKEYPDGIQKTIFKVQTYDWKRKKWINSRIVDRWLRTLVSSGAQHIAYYPDNCIDNKPDEKIIRLMMSSEDFPFKRE